jgi:hypothetical protein
MRIIITIVDAILVVVVVVGGGGRLDGTWTIHNGW